MSDWSRQPLRVLTTKIGSGATPRGGKEVYREEGVAFIRSQNVYDHAFSGSGIARLTDAAAAQLSGVTVEEGDVLVNITGESVTRTCLVDPRYLPARVSQHVAIVRADGAKLDPRFLAHALLDPPIKEHLNTLSEAGATRRALTKSNLESLQILVPPLPEQERIAGVFGAFDDLIETNRQLIEEILDLTRAMYGDAVSRADDEVPLGDLVVVNPDKRRPGPAHEPLNYLDIGALSDAQIGDANPLTWEGAPSRARQLASVGDTLWATVRPNRRAHGLLVREIPNLVVSTGIAVLRPLGVPMSLVFAHTDAQSFVDRLVLRGDGSAYPAVRGKDFLTIPIPRLDAEDLSIFRTVLDPMWQVVGQLEAEIADLARQRDELLPLLMSGRVRVDPEGTLVS